MSQFRVRASGCRPRSVWAGELSSPRQDAKPRWGKNQISLTHISFSRGRAQVTSRALLHRLGRVVRFQACDFSHFLASFLIDFVVAQRKKRSGSGVDVERKRKTSTTRSTRTFHNRRDITLTRAHQAKEKYEEYALKQAYTWQGTAFPPSQNLADSTSSTPPDVSFRTRTRTRTTTTTTTHGTGSH